MNVLGGRAGSVIPNAASDGVPKALILEHIFTCNSFNVKLRHDERSGKGISVYN